MKRNITIVIIEAIVILWSVPHIRSYFNKLTANDGAYRQETANAVKRADNQGSLDDRNTMLNRAISFEEARKKSLEDKISLYYHNLQDRVRGGNYRIYDDDGKCLTSDELREKNSELTHRWILTNERISQYKMALQENPYED